MASLLARTATNRLQVAPIQPLAVPMWLGAERRGVELGAVSLASRLTSGGDTLGRLLPAQRVQCPEPIAAEKSLNLRQLVFVDPVAQASIELRDHVAAAIAAGALPVVLGGDHAIAIGSLAGAASVGGRLGLVWLDSHLDLNTPETSPSGHLHGMALAIALGDGPAQLTAVAPGGRSIEPADVCLLGIRSIDPGEQHRLERTPMWLRSMTDWRRAGIARGARDALDYLTSRRVDAVHISFDLDVLDPSILPGTGTPVPGGLSLDEARIVVQELCAWDGPVRSLDWVELNPALDPTGGSEAVAAQLLNDILAGM